jgi:hypothetical protein
VGTANGVDQPCGGRAWVQLLVGVVK